MFYPVLTMKKSTTIYHKKIKRNKQLSNLKFKMKHSNFFDSDEEDNRNNGFHFPPIFNPFLKSQYMDKNLGNSFKPTVLNPNISNL